MKLLWITNIILPHACERINKAPPISGGWLTGFVDILSKKEDIQLCVATVFKGRNLLSFKVEGIEYYLIPTKKSKTKYDRSLEKYWRIICKSFEPDIIHIHGTEYNFGQSCLNACPDYRYVISIQGLCSVIERYYYAGIDIKDILLNITLRDLIKYDTILNARYKYKKRGIYEMEYIKRVHHIIGRTYWDKIHALTINNDINYHFCNDNLRNEFYNTNRRWNYNDIEKYTIYVSQGYYPIKGVHILLKAAYIVKRSYPKIKIYIAGDNPIKSNSIKDKYTISGYAKYLKKLIKKLSLDQNVIFTGPLTAKQVIEKLIKAHICVFPSSIENGSSIGEAQYLGTPGIASYAGGMTTTVNDEETGLLYRFEEYEILAYNIQRIFSDRALAKKLSKVGMIAACERHNWAVNTNNLISIYNLILQDNL